MTPAHQPHPTLIDRYHGALLGLAAGDALGTTLEFRSPGTFTPIDDMIALMAAIMAAGPRWRSRGRTGAG